MLKIGSHVPFKYPFFYLDSFKTALSYGANTFMIYSGAPQNTKRIDIEKIPINETILEMKKYNFNVNDLVGHAPYIINLANPSYEKRKFAISFITQELKRFEKLKIPQMVLHPGNAINKNREQSIFWIASGINSIFKNTLDLKIKIAIENMSGKGNEIGCCFEEIKKIIDLVENKKRISVCLDTCHLFDSGYDIKNNLENVIKKFDEIVNLKYITVLHINDSKNICGSKKDRHENIGFGHIGFHALMKIIYHPKFLNLPKILETPFFNNFPPYKEEIGMIKLKKFNNFLDRTTLI
ncbi:deoxyribonuclease IV [Candidatus Phytoplasma palmae]|uniref:deoxyribonuclease IV n=1 Tax=Candidatus Phytoplasma palmae TaxID=85624 RepID=UPI0039906274